MTTTSLDKGDFDALVNAVADRVLSLLSQSGLAAVDPLGAKLRGVRIDRPPRGRLVSDGMLNLASAVTYKLGKADPEKAEFNRIASGVAKLLYEEKRKRGELPVHENVG